jgi:DNA-binding response OmpR family regulator
MADEITHRGQDLIAGSRSVAGSPGSLNNSTNNAPRILSFESEPCILEFYRLVLEGEGYQFLGTCDVQEALHLLLTEPIDLFIQGLARGPGLIWLMKSERRLREIPVLVISGCDKVTGIDLFLKQAGLLLYRDLAGYLEKPFEVDDLLAFVETILVRRGKLPPR